MLHVLPDVDGCFSGGIHVEWLGIPGRAEGVGGREPPDTSVGEKVVGGGGGVPFAFAFAFSFGFPFALTSTWLGIIQIALF